MGGVDDPQLEILLACFTGHKTAGACRGRIDRRIKERGGAILDEVVVRVDHKGTVRAIDPRRIVLGTVTPFVTWGVFCVLAGLGWGGTVFWAVIGGLCGGLYVYYAEHTLTKNQLKKVASGLSPDSSGLVLWVRGADTKELLDGVAPEDPRVASAVSIGADLSAEVVAGAQHPADGSSAAPAGAPQNGNAAVSMLVFRYAGSDSAARINARAVAAGKQKHTKQSIVQSELLVRADKDGRDHVVSPGTGVRAFMPSDAIAWALFGVVYGVIVGVAGHGSLFFDTEKAVVTGILWGIFGLVAGTLYGLFAGRAISARRLKPLRPLLPPDTSIALCWAVGPLGDDRVAEWSASASDQLILMFKPVDGVAVLGV